MIYHIILYYVIVCHVSPQGDEEGADEGLLGGLRDAVVEDEVDGAAGKPEVPHNNNNNNNINNNDNNNKHDNINTSNV